MKGQGGMSDVPRDVAEGFAESSQKYYVELQELKQQITASLGLKCSACDDVGWYVGYHDGEPQQIQCEFCYTVDDSVFNVRRRLEAKDKDEPMTATEVMRRQYAIKPIELEFLFTEIGKHTSPQMAYRQLKRQHPMDRWVRCHMTGNGLVLGPPK